MNFIDFLKEATVNQLVQSTKQASKTTDRISNSSNIKIDKKDVTLFVTPHDDWANITFHFKAESQNTSGEKYTIVIKFFNVKLEEEPSLFTHWIKDSRDGKKYLIEKLDVEKHNIKIHCECQDYSNTFQYNNSLKDIAYISKTIKNTRVKHENEGMCKHIMAALNYMRERNLLLFN